MLRLFKYLPGFAWIIGIVMAYGVYIAHGLPHMVWSYTYMNNGQPHNPYAHRIYTSCTFVGPYGVFTVPDQAGKCGWIKFFQEKG